jgi:hypothetical protein
MLKEPFGPVRIKASEVNMAAAMPCLEYIRLRQLYEAALRYWGQILLSPKATELFDAPARHAAQLRQNALDERDAAGALLFVHEQHCSVCRAKPKLIESDKAIASVEESVKPSGKWTR